MTTAMRVISVLGGTGIFGARVAEALARDPRCQVRIVGRNAKVGRNLAHRIGAEFLARDLGDRDSLRRAIDGSFVVIHGAGPSRGMIIGWPSCAWSWVPITWTWPTRATSSPGSAAWTNRPAGAGS
jgi:hypothetical protein